MKNNILIVDNDSNFIEIVYTIIENYFDSSIKDVNSASLAIDALKAETFTYILLSTQFQISELKSLISFSNIKDIPIILLKENNDTNALLHEFEFAGTINKSNIIIELPQKLKKVDSAASTIEECILPKFSKVRLSSLEKINTLSCDVFVKLSETKFVKILNKNDLFGKEDTFKYTGRGLTHAHIENKNLEEFLNNFLRNITGINAVSKYKTNPELIDTLNIKDVDILEDLKNISKSLLKAKNNNLEIEHSKHISEQSLKKIHTAYHKLQINEDTKTLIKVSASLAVYTISKSPQLNDLFTKKFDKKDSYICSHSVQLAEIACMIAAQMGWNSELTRYKLSLAAFLHDLTLKNPQLAEIQRLDDIRILVDKKAHDLENEIRNHPIGAAELTRQLQEIPPDVDDIVLQHHERPSGHGFPNNLSAKAITPLSTVFIVAHDLVDYLYSKDEENINMKDFIYRNHAEYTSGLFKNIALKISKN